MLGEGLDRVGEAHRLAHVGDPVGGVGGLLWVEQLSGDVGDDRDLGLAEGEALGDLGELLEHRLHQGRVEGVGDGEAFGLFALVLPLGADRFDCFLGAGDHGRGRAVDRGDRQLCLFAFDRLGDLVLGGLDRRHRPARGQGAHQAAPGGDELGGVGQLEDAGDVGGGDLADRVAGEEVGLQAALG